MEDKKFLELIGTAVVKGITFEAAIGTSSYTVSDLIHTVKPESLDAMYQRLMKQLKSINVDSLAVSTAASTRKTNILTYKTELIKAIYTYKVNLATQKAELAKVKAERKEKLAILEQFKTQKEMEALSKLSLEDIQKQISALSAD